MSDRADTLHNRLLEQACGEKPPCNIREDLPEAVSWKRLPWKRTVLRKLREEPWVDEADCSGATGDDDDWRRLLSKVDEDELAWPIRSMLLQVKCVPDAWRLRVEGPKEGWGYPVLVLEFLEIEVTNHIDDRKLIQYNNLWWGLDGTDMFHFRVFRMDRYGIVTPLLTEDTAQNIVAYLHGPDGRRKRK